MPGVTLRTSLLVLAFAVCSTIIVGQDMNLVVNGSFEERVHNLPAGWMNELDEKDQAIATWNIDGGATGSGNSVRIDCTSSPMPGTSYAALLQKGIALIAGREYTLAFKARSAAIADSAFSVQVKDTRNLSVPVFRAIVRAGTEWKEFQFAFKPDRDMSRDNSLLQFVLASTGTVWLDDVSLQSTSNAGANVVAAPRFQPRLARTASRNLIPNGSFECGGDGWLSLGEGLPYGGNVAGLYGNIETGRSPDGAHSFRIDHGPGLTPESYFDCFPPQYIRQRRLLVANRGWMDVEPGRPYTLSAFMRSDRPGTKGVLQFVFNADANKSMEPLTKEVLLTGEWQRFSYTVIAPADSVYIAVGADVRDAAMSANIMFWVDAIQLEAGESMSSFEPRNPVEFGFNSERYGNVYSAGPSPTIQIVGHNTSSVPKEITFDIQLTDYWDQHLPARTIALTLPANGRSVLPLPLNLPTGYYRAQFSWNLDGQAHIHRMQLSVIEPYKHDDSPFGLNHGPTTLEACRQIRQAGVTWIRDWAVNWEWAEPQRGKLSFAPIDPHLQRLRKAGMNILSLLPSNPSTSWSTTAPDSVPNKSWYRLAYAPKDPGLLFDFVAKAASHYKGLVTYWEFLNEPLWVPDFCLPKKGGYTIETYIGLLKGAAKAIRSSNPDAKVLGGLAIQPEITFGDEFIKAGGLDFVDIFNLHPYAGTREPESFIPNMERIWRVMDEFGIRKTIWATEAAYYGIDEFPYLPWSPPVNQFAANRLLKSERQAGDYIVRFSTIMLSYGVEKIFWHEPIADDANKGVTDIENPFVAPGGFLRKACVALSAFTNLLGPKPAFGGRLQVPKQVSGQGTDNVHGYAFANGESSILIAWATEKRGEANWTIHPPAHSMVRSVTGALLEGSGIRLSESPVYIQSNSLTPGELARQCVLTALQ